MFGEPGVDGGDVDNGVYEGVREGTEELELVGEADAVSICIALLAKCKI